MKKSHLSRIIVLFLIFVTIFSTITKAGAQAPRLQSDPPEPPASGESQQQVVTSQVYLPCVVNDCYGAAPSPFAIQIAGLSEITPTVGMSRADINQLRLEQYAQLDAAFPTLIDALRETGAGWARVYVDWATIEFNQGNYFWDYYDSWFRQITSAGVQIIATVSNPPGWAITVSNPCSNRINPANVPDFTTFLTALVNRYNVAPYNVHVWEVLNEPDAIDGVRCNTGASNYGQHGAEYASLVKTAYPVIKAADPSAKVLMGGVAYDSFYLPYNDTTYFDGSLSGQFNRYFMDDVVKVAGVNNATDAVNFHYFHDFYKEWERWTVPNANPPRCGNYTIRDKTKPAYFTTGLDIVAKGTHFLNRLKTCYNFNKPLWITEVGHHGMTNPPVDHPEYALDYQARYVFTVFARSLSLGVENITWYALKIIPSITTNDYQGLLYDDRDGALNNQPKPAFYAFKALTRELTGYRFSSAISAPSTMDSIEAYQFSHPCRSPKIIAWYNPGNMQQKLFNIPFTTSRVRLVYRPNADGTEHQAEVQDGSPEDLDGLTNNRITIALSNEPVIIQAVP